MGWEQQHQIRHACSSTVPAWREGAKHLAMLLFRGLLCACTRRVQAADVERLCGAPACRYFDFVNFNTTGYRPYVTTLYAVLLGCLRKSISRILVLIVSMGYGVVLPYLGAIQHKVSALLAHLALSWL